MQPFHSDVVLPFTYQGKNYKVYIDFGSQRTTIERIEYNPQTSLCHQDENGKWVLDDPPDFMERYGEEHELA